MAAAEDALNDAVVEYRDAIRSEEVRAGVVAVAALKTAAPWAVDVHMLHLVLEVDPALPAADRVKIVTSRIEPRWPPALAKAASIIMSE